jgi:hypothetical protein
MRSLVDFLVVKTPLVALIDRDQRWSRMVLADTVDALSGSLGPVLEWTAASGWRGPEGVIGASGLTKLSMNNKEEINPAFYLDQLYSWMSPNSADGAEALERFPFRSGVAIFSDLEPQLKTALLSRVLFNLPDVLSLHGATGILLLSAPLPYDHPLHSCIVQVFAGGTGVDRFGGFIAGLLEQFKFPHDDDMVKQIADRLDGLTVTLAEAVLRLTALDLVQEETLPPFKLLPDLVARVRREVEFPTTVGSV